MEKAKLDCTGPAYIIVPISEDVCTRWLFNDIVDHVQDHNVKDQDELIFVNDVMNQFFDYLVEHSEAAATLLPQPIESNRQEFKDFHKSVLTNMEQGD